MENELPGIEITVSGEPDSGKTLVCNVINSALNEAGFSNVNIVDNQGETVAPYEVRSYLDLARQGRPDLFATPITITESITTPDDEPEELDDPVIPDEVVLAQNLSQLENYEAAEA